MLRLLTAKSNLLLNVILLTARSVCSNKKSESAALHDHYKQEES